MNKELEAQWREEFESIKEVICETASAYFIYDRFHSEGDYSDYDAQISWSIYLAARKKAQEEIEKRDELLEQAEVFIKKSCGTDMVQWLKEVGN